MDKKKADNIFDNSVLDELEHQLKVKKKSTVTKGNSSDLDDLREQLDVNKQDIASLQENNGDIGSRTNPIPVENATGEINYIAKLRTKTNKRVFFHRVGSIKSPISKDMLDMFEVVGVDKKQRTILYFNIDQDKKDELPKGFHTSLVSEHPLIYLGSSENISDFPYGIGDALKFHFEGELRIRVEKIFKKYIALYSGDKQGFFIKKTSETIISDKNMNHPIKDTKKSNGNEFKKTILNEEKYFEIALNEIELNNLSKGLWAKSLANTEGDKARAEALYLKERAKQLQGIHKNNIKDKNPSNGSHNKKHQPVIDNQQKDGNKKTTTSTLRLQIALILSIGYVAWSVLLSFIYKTELSGNELAMKTVVGIGLFPVLYLFFLFTGMYSKEDNINKEIKKTSKGNYLGVFVSTIIILVFFLPLINNGTFERPHLLGIAFWGFIIVQCSLNIYKSK